MKKRKTFLVTAVATCMLATSFPTAGLENVFAADGSVIGFTDQNNRGGWAKTSGNGTIGFTDGEGAEGFMTVSSDGNTIFADETGTSRTDGYVEMDLNMTEAPTGVRMAIIFRYNSPTDWDGIGLDSGNWMWFTGDGSYGNVSASKTSFTSVGEHHKIRVEYRGNSVRVLEDGTEIINTTVSGYGGNSGTVGMRLWGGVDPSWDGHCTFQVDNVRTGDLTEEAVISPESFRLDYAEAGSKDIQVTLGEKNPELTAVSADGTPLEKDRDYTVSGNQVTIKASYIEKIRETSLTELSFEFADGQKKTCSIYIEKPEEKVEYRRDFSDGTDGFEMVSGSGTLQEENGGAVMSGNGIFIDQNSASLKNQEVEFTFDPLNNNCNYGVVLRYTDPDNYIYVGPASQNSQHYTNWGIYGPGGQLASIQDSGFVLEGREKPYKVKVRIVDSWITIFLDNEEIYNGEISGMTMAAGKTGFRSTASTNFSVYDLTQTNASAPETEEGTITEAQIRSDEMSVALDKDFPRVIRYDLDGTTVTGQEIPVHEVEINNTAYTPEVTSEIEGNEAVYHMTVEELGLSFDTVFTVEDNVLTMKIKNIKEGDTKLYTLNFPRHSLVSMSGKDANAQLVVNNYQAQTVKNLSTAQATASYGETTLAVLSSDNAAAAVSGLSYKNRHETAYQTFDAGDHTSTGLWVNEYTYRGLDGKVMIEEPWAKVSVTKDRNADGKIDYQDGAIALRDDCMQGKTGADTVTDSWNMIAMNVGSEAQYPFLRILDNAKKISLATDNFGQNIIIKGYQSQGHDASHPDFANYNENAGGLKDFRTLLKESEAYNTKIGIHINHTDVYPESPQYSELATGLGAWSWYDSASQIVRENDVLGEFGQSEKGMYGRFAQLFDTDTEGMIDTTYVDVFFGTRWPMYNLINNINGMGREMALGTEYVDEMVSFSVFAHHIGSDFGGAGSLVRFVDNNQADIFTYSNLFRGASSRANDDVGIDGWQSAKNLNNALKAFYERILPNKYLAQFPVMQYESNTKAVLGKNNEVVTEMVNGVNRISKDGKVIADGNKIFIPWDSETEDKIYHWNTAGGKSSWELPDSWSNVETAALYKLTEKGKELVDTYDVSDGTITIDAEASQGYVLYKDKIAEKDIETADTVEWSTGSPVKDMGFDSYNFDEWKPDSTTSEDTDHIVIEDNSLGNAHLYIKGTDDGQVEQTLTGLKKGQTYSASVWCITDDGRKASIEVDNGDETVSNYMDRSNVLYGIHHNDKYQTYAQRMQVRFTAESDTAVLRLSAAAGDDPSSVVDFDDVRVAEVDQDTNPDPDKYTYWEDFENTDQGFGVFVSTESDQSHLSQVNPENPELTTDVIDGTYSLKIRAGDYMRTIPATVRFEPNTEYTVGISYKSPNADPFTLAVKSDKAEENGDSSAAVLESVQAAGTEGKLEISFTTGDYDDYYVDITKANATEYYLDNFYVEEARPINYDTLQLLISEAEEADESAYTPESYKVLTEALKDARAIGKEASKDEITPVYNALESAIDGLVAYAQAEDKEALSSLIVEMKSLLSSDYKTDEQWIAFQTKIAEAEEIYADNKATRPQVSAVMEELRDAKNNLNPFVDRTELRAIMERADRVDRGVIVDGAELQNFLSAKENAAATDIKPGVTAEEIKTAADTLTDAYNAIILKDESKETLLSQALKLADEEESYFLEADWNEIMGAKTAFTEMQAAEKVKAADYYDNLIRLENALANKLSRPVIPTAVEISSDDFKVSANTAQSASGNEGPVEYAFDGNPATYWHSAWTGFTVSASNPAEVTIDLGKVYTLNQFSYLQRPSGGNNGKIQRYNLYVKKAENDEWMPVVENGTFSDVQQVQKVSFDAADARYVKIQVTQGYGSFASASEFVLYQKASDFSGLQSVMNELDKLDQTLYTKSSYKAASDKYDEAEKLLENLLTPQDEIDRIKEELQSAIDRLELIAGSSDIKMLKDAVEDAEKVNVEDYEDTEAFEAALAAAEELLKKSDSGEELTQSEVRKAALDLVTAHEQLVPIDKSADKSQLEEAIKNALSDEEAAGYTSDSWKAYQTALDAANKVFQDPDATQKQVDDALEVLKDAEKALVPVSGGEEIPGDGSETPDQKPGEDQKPDAGQKPDSEQKPDSAQKPDAGQSGKENGVQTGDSTPAASAAVMTAAAGALVLAVLRRRRNS